MLWANPCRPCGHHETSDNPGGGAPGDGTHLLQAMLKADGQYLRGFIVDPSRQKLAHEIGVGGHIETQLSGKRMICAANLSPYRLT